MTLFVIHFIIFFFACKLIEQCNSNFSSHYPDCGRVLSLRLFLSFKLEILANRKLFCNFRKHLILILKKICLKNLVYLSKHFKVVLNFSSGECHWCPLNGEILMTNW